MQSLISADDMKEAAASLMYPRGNIMERHECIKCLPELVWDVETMFSIVLHVLADMLTYSIYTVVIRVGTRFVWDSCFLSLCG